MVDAETKKKWLNKLFLGIHWNKGEICKYCYSDLPGWHSYVGSFIKHCDYCGKAKPGGTIAPWNIPDETLKRLMKERVWSKQKR